MRMQRSLVVSLAIVAGLAGAEDRPFDFSPENPPNTGAASGVAGPGTAMAVGAGRRPTAGNRQVFLQGVVEMDFISQTNYSDGNEDIRDHRNNGLLRSELGARVELDERLEAKLTVAYQAETGGTAFVPGSTTQVDSSSPVVMDDAYVVLKEFFSLPELAIKAGRMPEVWNLRSDYGAFLYDSRANYPEVTSWDGVRGRYNLDTITITPYAYHLPDDSRLFGLALDWQPEEGDSNNLFLTGSANVERDAQLPDPAVAGDTFASDTLFTYYGGIEAKFDIGFDIWGEGALQNGDQDDDIGFKGYAFSAGADWRAPTLTQFAVGGQFDYFSGDDDALDDENHAFINTWEGISDTYIVEHEKYGELSRATQAQAGLQAAKLRVEVGLPPDNRFRFKLVYGYYQLTEDVNEADDFGQEIDLTATWQYTYNATFNLFGALFLPDDGFVETAPVGAALAGDDEVWLLGVNLLVAF